MKVLKFGGSSLADGRGFEAVRKIIEAEEARRVVVVSAPGKRFSGDKKITDLLCHACLCAKKGGNCDRIVDEVRGRFVEICENLSLDCGIEEELRYVTEGLNGVDKDAEVISRGEHFAARLMAKYIGFEFVDAADVIAFDYNGRVNMKRSEKLLKSRLSASRGIVVPGFYGSYPNGAVRLLQRGGSDVTGALISAILMAELYENWTDVDGVMTADPSIAQNARVIREVSFSEMIAMSRAGASVIQEDTLQPLFGRNIPVAVRNTFNPRLSGTIISEKHSPVARPEIAVSVLNNMLLLSFDFKGAVTQEILVNVRKRGFLSGYANFSGNSVTVVVKNAEGLLSLARDLAEDLGGTLAVSERVSFISVFGIARSVGADVIAESVAKASDIGASALFLYVSADKSSFGFCVEEGFSLSAVCAVHAGFSFRGQVGNI